MGNTPSMGMPGMPGMSTPSKSSGTSSSSKKKSSSSKGSAKDTSTSAAAQAAESATERAKKVLGDVQESLKSSVKKLEEQDHPAAQLIDTVCGPYMDYGGSSQRKMRENRSASFYSEDYNSDDSRTISEDEQTLDTDYNASTVRGGSTVASSAVAATDKDSAYLSQSDYESEVGTGHVTNRRRKKRDKQRHSSNTVSDDDDDEQTMDNSSSAAPAVQLLSKPLASSFAKRCYFTKAGIGKTTQHYEGLTLTGNVVLMLAAAMKLKGCPTICDEDLRRVEQTYPNQFSRLPDELLLSSGWRRISKYCHFSNKPIPDGIPFFHSKQRLHPQGGYYFLLAAAVGMVRPIDVEPLTRDTLVLLETDYPTQCDAAPEVLIQDPEEWTLVDKLCFFSGGPINTEEDVYYQADFDGNPIYMLAFLSPSLTPEELYKLEQGLEITDDLGNPIPGLTSVNAVQEVESVYDLTERDFHDLKLYHLGPCRALPQYILQPHAWTKVLPPHFLEARHQAILRAQQYELANGGPVTSLSSPRDPMATGPSPSSQQQQLTLGATPADPHYGDYPPQPQNNNIDNTNGMDGQNTLQPGQDENGYYMSPRQQQGGEPQGFSSEYEAVGAHNSASMADSNMAAYQQQQQEFHSQPYHPHDDDDDEYQQQQQYSHSSPVAQQDSPQDYQDEERSRHSAQFQREMEEEGAFPSPHAHDAPLDEAIATRKMGPPGTNGTHQGMDPPEHVPPDPEVDDSVDVSGANMSPTPNNLSRASEGTGSYYHPQDTLELSKSDTSQYSNELGMDSPGRGDAPSYGGEGGGEEMPQYSYSMSPNDKEEDGYYHEHLQEQSRDDQYYDSPEGGLKNQPGSQDHEFFNAHSGGGEDEEDYDPSQVSSFDPHGQVGGRHPDDHDQYDNGGGYYVDEEEDSRLDLAESSSAEYFRGGHPGDESPSPIKMDHLQRLGRKNQQPQTSPRRAMASPMSQASSQNSVSEYSHSSAMRGAQELLKRNRQRRHEQARRRIANAEVRVNDDSLESDVSPLKSSTQYAFGPDENGDTFSPSPQHNRGGGGDDGSASTWESNNDSEALASVISGSSVWTDNSSNPADRSSRRALILQMAKARMKSNKERDPAEKTIKEEKSGSLDMDDSHDHDEFSVDHSDMRPQVLSDATTATDLDFAADLD